MRLDQTDNTRLVTRRIWVIQIMQTLLDNRRETAEHGSQKAGATTVKNVPSTMTLNDRVHSVAAPPGGRLDHRAATAHSAQTTTRRANALLVRLPTARRTKQRALSGKRDSAATTGAPGGTARRVRTTRQENAVSVRNVTSSTRVLCGKETTLQLQRRAENREDLQRNVHRNKSTT